MSGTKRPGSKGPGRNVLDAIRPVKMSGAKHRGPKVRMRNRGETTWMRYIQSKMFGAKHRGPKSPDAKRPGPKCPGVKRPGPKSCGGGGVGGETFWSGTSGGETSWSKTLLAGGGGQGFLKTLQNPHIVSEQHVASDCWASYLKVL